MLASRTGSKEAVRWGDGLAPFGFTISSSACI
jgi:hypothetical protein